MEFQAAFFFFSVGAHMRMLRHDHVDPPCVGVFVYCGPSTGQDQAAGSPHVHKDTNVHRASREAFFLEVVMDWLTSSTAWQDEVCALAATSVSLCNFRYV